MSVIKHCTQTNDSSIELSEKARAHFYHYLKKNKAQSVRLSVKKTGCSGLSYVIDYVDEVNQSDVMQALDDTYSLYIEKKSYPYLKGLKIDMVQEGLNKKLKFVNPNQTGECGCGESFTID